MSVQVPLTRTRRGRKSSSKITSLLWIYAWILTSSIPLIPYATPLWSGALADTPYAYLVWVPVFAFTWAGWTLRRTLQYNDDAELNSIIGIPMLIFCSILLITGMTQWQYYFVGQSIGLLIWPFWSLGLAWMMFGVGVTRYLYRPLSYLILTWPPLYTDIVNFTNPILLDFANRFVTAMEKGLPWLHAGSALGTYIIHYVNQSITVYVTSVCSGADSLLAIVILFPIILVSFTGNFIRKTISLLLAIVLALLANWLRLAILIFSIHWFGPNFSLGILHPILGILLFMLMVAIVVKFSHVIGLENRHFTKGTFLRKPGRIRFTLSILIATSLTVMLFPLYKNSLGTDRAPLVLTTENLQSLMPKIQGWTRKLYGRYDASTLLGPGAKTTVFSYLSPFNDYVTEEWWLSFQPISLIGYSEHNCLLFHGAQILSEQTIAISQGIKGTVFTVLLPPTHIGGPQNLYFDTVYTFAAKYHGKLAYIRSETATPIALQIDPSNQIVHAVPNLVPLLIKHARSTPYTSFQPLTPDNTVHLENYFVFIQQASNKTFSM